MIDHLIVVTDPPNLSLLGIDAPDPANPMQGEFDGTQVDVIKVAVIQVEATEEAGPVTAPGFWFCVRAERRLDLPWPFVSITDSDLADLGGPFVLAIGEGWEWHQLTARVFPVWAGTGYPFGPNMGPEMLVP